MMNNPFGPRYDEQSDQLAKEYQNSKDNILRSFLTKPIPLPALIWNLFVVGLYIAIGLFLLQIVFAVLIGILSLFA